MTDILEDRRYSPEHEWALVDLDDAQVVLIGLSDYAQAQLGDIVMVELPDEGLEVAPEDVLGAVESPKSVADVFAPVGGEVVGVNEALLDEPELINSSPYEDGWYCKIRMSDTGEFEDLMDAAAYGEHVAALDEE